MWHTPINPEFRKIRNSKPMSFPASSLYLKYMKAMIKMACTSQELDSHGFTNTRERSVNPRNKPGRKIFDAINYLVEIVYREVQKGHENRFKNLTTSHHSMRESYMDRLLMFVQICLPEWPMSHSLFLAPEDVVVTLNSASADFQFVFFKICLLTKKSHSPIMRR